jgi:hypothetical protein
MIGNGSESCFYRSFCKVAEKTIIISVMGRDVAYLDNDLWPAAGEVPT